MDLMTLVDAAMSGREIDIRTWVNDAQREREQLSQLPSPPSTTPAERCSLAAGLAELLAERWNVAPPAWTSAFGALPGELWLASFARAHPALAERCRLHGPAPLRQRRIWAMPDFLTSV